MVREVYEERLTGDGITDGKPKKKKKRNHWFERLWEDMRGRVIVGPRRDGFSPQY